MEVCRLEDKNGARSDLCTLSCSLSHRCRSTFQFGLFPKTSLILRLSPLSAHWNYPNYDFMLSSWWLQSRVHNMSERKRKQCYCPRSIKERSYQPRRINTSSFLFILLPKKIFSSNLREHLNMESIADLDWQLALKLEKFDISSKHTIHSRSAQNWSLNMAQKTLYHDHRRGSCFF